MESEELIRQIMAEVMANLGKDQVSFAKKPAANGASGQVDASNYPLGEKMPEKIKAANRFDIRRIIGGLFVVYGVVLVVVGIAGSHEVKTKAAGININLWAGLAMLAFAAGMIAWALLRPVAPPDRDG